MDFLGRIVVVVYTLRGDSIRLISARQAKPMQQAISATPSEVRSFLFRKGRRASPFESMTTSWIGSVSR
jgi:hypothetical protein